MNAARSGLVRECVRVTRQHSVCLNCLYEASKIAPQNGTQQYIRSLFRVAKDHSDAHDTLQPNNTACEGVLAAIDEGCVLKLFQAMMHMRGLFVVPGALSKAIMQGEDMLSAVLDAGIADLEEEWDDVMNIAVVKRHHVLMHRMANILIQRIGGERARTKLYNNMIASASVGHWGIMRKLHAVITDTWGDSCIPKRILRMIRKLQRQQRLPASQPQRAQSNH